MADPGAPTVGTIIQDLCGFVGVSDVDTSAVDDIEVRGLVSAGLYSAADTIRLLMRTYFFDMVEIDGLLTAVLRGGSVAATIDHDDMVIGHEAVFETTREQMVEFPRKIHLLFASAESDYTPTKQTAERRSVDIQSASEITVDVPINLEADDAAQIVDKMQKTAWVEAAGPVKFAVSEKFVYLVPSDIVSVETESGTYRRCRVREMSAVDGTLQLEAVEDRASVYDSDVTAPSVVDPIDPTSNLPGATTFELMDLPALSQEHDTLHLYVAAHGDEDAAWTGAVVEQLIDTEWIELAQVTYPSSIGQAEESLPSHAAGIDTTNDVLVSLSDDDIATITQAEFDAGGNMALIGDEIIQFRDVVQEGDDYRISYLNRGVFNTTPALHAIGSRFVILDAPTVVPMDASYIGESVTLRCYSFGTTPDVSNEDTLTFNGNSQIEWQPLIPTIDLDSNDDWLIDWDHNKRIGYPNSPVISQHFLNFVVTLTKSGTTVTLTTDDEGLTYSDAEQLADFGALVTSWDTATVHGVNRYTGAGTVATLVVITGDKLLFEDGSGYLMFEDDSGVLLLE